MGDLFDLSFTLHFLKRSCVYGKVSIRSHSPRVGLSDHKLHTAEVKRQSQVRQEGSGGEQRQIRVGYSGYRRWQARLRGQGEGHATRGWLSAVLPISAEIRIRFESASLAVIRASRRNS